MQYVGVEEEDEVRDVCRCVNVEDRYETDASDCENETGNQVSKWHLLVACPLAFHVCPSYKHSSRKWKELSIREEVGVVVIIIASAAEDTTFLNIVLTCKWNID